MKKSFKIIISMFLLVAMMVNTVYASSVTKTADLYKTSLQYSINMGITVTATAKFTDISSTTSKGESITFSFSNEINVSSISQSGNLRITQGSTATVQKTFTLFYNLNSHRYYTGDVVDGKCVVGTSGQRTLTCTFSPLDNIQTVY